MQIPFNFYSEREKALLAVAKIDGIVKKKEMQFLFTLGACKFGEGSILEIGSFLGRSTIVLSKGAKLAGDLKMYAVDPMMLLYENNPKAEKKSLRQEFYNNI